MREGEGEGGREGDRESEREREREREREGEREKREKVRCHSLKLQKSYSHTDVHNHFFMNRIIDSWNRLPEETMTAASLAEHFQKEIEISGHRLKETR